MLDYTRAPTRSGFEATVTDSDKQATSWSDQKVDVLATLVVFSALVFAAVYFISNQV